MKTIYSILILVLFSLPCFGQNYQPFNELSSKRFFEISDLLDNNYFFHTDSSSMSGDSIIFHQYYKVKDFSLPTSPNPCPTWGGPSIILLDTTWLGNTIVWNTMTYELQLKSESNELINFDFGLPIGASSQFYSDGAINYSIEHTSTDLETFLTVSDSVQVFTINATDINGVSVSSPLNTFEIRLSKNYGLISFIDCYNFPSVQEGYQLQGQTNPILGNYQLTLDECYTWNVGDVIQYSTSNNIDPSNGINKMAYQTITISDRIETIDSITILFTSTVHELDPALNIPMYNLPADPIKFKKETPVSYRPWNGSQTNLLLSKASEDSLSWCGNTPSYYWAEYLMEYCDSCKCYGGMDNFGQSATTWEYAGDLGIYRQFDQDYGFPSSGGIRSRQTIYSNVNGVECGTLWSGQNELLLFNLMLYPNPTADILRINCDLSIESIRVIDLSGRVIIALDKINQKTTEISLASFQKGAYILEVTADGLTRKQTIIKE